MAVEWSQWTEESKLLFLLKCNARLICLYAQTKVKQCRIIGEELQPGSSSFKEVMIVVQICILWIPTARTAKTPIHLVAKINPSSSENKAPRRKSTFFTINEVEALVQAVRRHGPGRWKMIKDEAFGNDSRRTRIDLRDKWKSLVKTANLPAHKRRRVVLPEELLEMVRYVDQNGMQIPPASHACSIMIQ